MDDTTHQMAFDPLKEKDLCAFEGPAVEVRNLTKLFGTFKAVDRVDFDVYPGEIVGLLGPNGAGKTTIIHMLLGLTTQSGGSIKLFGLDFARNKERILECVNFSSTYVSMPFSLTVLECLKVFARLYRVRRSRGIIDELLETFEMTESRNKQVRHLSTGQQTRLNLAKAFVNDPKVLLLDEPTASLDPDIADKTRTLLIQAVAKKKMAVLYTSHNMQEMEKISTRIIFLHEGKILASGRPEDVVNLFSGQNLEEVFLKVIRERKE